MAWFLVMFLTILAGSHAINRPVYKIVLTQKGYTQFLQYDMETPPLREFTFCTWIRVYDLEGDQTIFSYVVNGNNRLLRLWLDSGGHYLKFTINDKLTSVTPINVVNDVWRHVCLSYQSDFGAWAIYMDSKLLTCQSAQSLYGFVFPGGGSVIIGYGTAFNGTSNGLEGEVFGVNMLLLSTIEKNRSATQNEIYHQKSFQRNKVKNSEKNIKYVILSDLKTGEIHNNYEKKSMTPFINRTNEDKRLQTDKTLTDHDVGQNFGSTKEKFLDLSSEKELIDLSVTDKITTPSFWNFVNTAAGQAGKFNVNQKEKTNREQSKSSTKDVIMITEYETPPPPPLPGLLKNEHSMKLKELEIPPVSRPFNKKGLNGYTNKFLTKNIANLPDVERPQQKDPKLYGQRTSSKLAGGVLNYLKSINFYNRDFKTPATLPLTKISDSFPFASDFKMSKLKTPIKFRRRSFIDNIIKLHKRDINYSPQINVEILEEDLSSNILKTHAKARSKKLQLTNRGANQKYMDYRYYRHTEDKESSQENYDRMDRIIKPRSFSTTSNIKNNKKPMSHLGFHKNNNYNLMTILPFLKSLEYFVEDSRNTASEHQTRSRDMYSKSLSNANKWHNVKSYNNDYTPRRIKLDSDDENTNLDYKIAEANKKNPSIRLKYMHESSKIEPAGDDPSIIKGREMALQMSNHLKTNVDSVSIIKYNHGYLPSQDKNNGEAQPITKSNMKQKRKNDKNNFNTLVKLGNILNEHHVVGYNEEQKKKSFIRAYDNVPDINKYKSEIDSENMNLTILEPRVCKNIQIGSRLLYIQQDESIIASHIESPVRKKNIAAEFIHQNYNKCSLEGSNFETSYWLFIDWSNTPVRLFGGAYPKTTTDLCGFF